METIGQCDVRHIMTLQIKLIMSALKVLTYIITSITAHPIDLSVIISVLGLHNCRIQYIIYLDMTEHATILRCQILQVSLSQVFCFHI
jgi:hypothetical protein